MNTLKQFYLKNKFNFDYNKPSQKNLIDLFHHWLNANKDLFPETYELLLSLNKQITPENYPLASIGYYNNFLFLNLNISLFTNNNITTNVLVYILNHELLHYLLNHFERFKNLIHINKELCNIATDLEINSSLGYLKELPNLFYPENLNLPQHDIAENYYNYLYNEYDNIKDKLQDIKDYLNNKNENESDENNKNGDNKSDNNDDNETDENNKEGEGQLKEKSKSKKFIINRDFTDDINDTSQSEYINDINNKIKISKELLNKYNEIQEYKKMYGKGTSELSRFIERVKIKPKWQINIVNFFKSLKQKIKFTYRKPHKRYETIILPYKYKEKKISCYVFIDSSGSISDLNLVKFIEFANYSQEYLDIKKMFFFTDEVFEIKNFQKFLMNKKHYERKYIGGTSFSVIYDYISKVKDTIDVIFIITDGFADFPSQYPKFVYTIWLVDNKEGYDLIIKNKDNKDLVYLLEY